MSVSEELAAKVEEINVATNKLAVVVRALRDATTTSMTQEEVDAHKAALGSIAGKLDGIAATPEAPVPPGPEVVFSSRRQ
jgi:hypothetical protein